MIVDEALQWLRRELGVHQFADPGLEARHLLTELLDVTTASLIQNGDRILLPMQQARLQDWLKRRLAGEPLAYLCAHKGFYKSDFIIRPGVLIPRPETELVVIVATQRSNNPLQIADLGCGSGCIGLSLLQEFPQARLVAVDISSLGCELTAENAKRLRLEPRVEVLCQDVRHWEGPADLDLVVANPPYIANGDLRVEAHVQNFEPGLALFAGADGLDSLRSWIPMAFSRLEGNGIFVTEIGAGQDSTVSKILHETGFVDIQASLDLQGIVRVLSARKEVIHG